MKSSTSSSPHSVAPTTADNSYPSDDRRRRRFRLSSSSSQSPQSQSSSLLSLRGTLSDADILIRGMSQSTLDLISSTGSDSSAEPGPRKASSCSCCSARPPNIGGGCQRCLFPNDLPLPTASTTTTTASSSSSSSLATVESKSKSRSKSKSLSKAATVPDPRCTHEAPPPQLLLPPSTKPVASAIHNAPTDRSSKPPPHAQMKSSSALSSSSSPQLRPAPELQPQSSSSSAARRVPYSWARFFLSTQFNFVSLSQRDEDIPQTTKRIRVYNLYFNSRQLVVTVALGFLVCLDAFLHTFAGLPVRSLVAVCRLVAFIARRVWSSIRSGGAHNHGPSAGHGDSTGGGNYSGGRGGGRNGGGLEEKEPVPPVNAKPSATTEATTAPSSSSTAAPGDAGTAASGGSSELRPSAADVNDVLKGLIAVAAFAVLVNIPQLAYSRVYHLIRGENTLKLYVLFNCLDVFDKLLCSFGQDAMDALAWSAVSLSGRSGRKMIFLLVDFLVCSIYAVLHTILLLFEVVTINVAVNSSSNALIVILVSNNFAELKHSVFKKCENENLFQITCADIVEMFQLCIFAVAVCMQNARSANLGIGEITLMITMLGVEIIVDMVKHGFATKFNSIDPLVYEKFRAILYQDITSFMDMDTLRDNITVVCRRIGFIPLPYGLLLVWIIHGSFSLSLSCCILVGGSLVMLLLLRSVVHVFLLGYASRVRRRTILTRDVSNST